MIRQRVQEIKNQAQLVRQEYNEICALLDKKRAEIDGLVKGADKFKNDPKYLGQIEGVVRQKVKEIKGLNERSKHLRKICRQGKRELQKLAKQIDASKTMRNEAIVKIASSRTTEKVLDSIFASGEKKAAKTKKTAPVKAKKQVHKEGVKLEAEPVKAKKTKANLYDRAASEAKAQEAFLKSKGPKIYGNM